MYKSVLCMLFVIFIFLCAMLLKGYVMYLLLALEDDAFFSHKGMNIETMRTALKTNIRAKRIVMGGSTLTQQLAKNLLFGFDKTYTELKMTKAMWDNIIKEIIVGEHKDILIFLCQKGKVDTR